MTGGSTPHTERDREVLQERLAVQGLIAGTLSVIFVLLVRLAGGRAFAPPQLAELGVALVGFAYLASWGLARGRALPHRALQGLDVGLIVCVGIGCGLHGWFGPTADTRFDSLLAINNALLVRAILLPSTPVRTLGIGAAALVPVVAPALAALAGLFSPPSYIGLQLQAAIFVGWALVLLVVPVLVSRIVYDLRREVASAKRLGPYELGERIGAGAMGEVFRANHALLRRATAIKLLRAERAGEAAIARFEREVQLTASLTHPNTVAVYDFGRTSDRVFYYAMELLDGWNLREIVERGGPLPPERAVHILRQICASLNEAHQQGLVHRDIKAANVMLCRRAGMYDVVKVVDFGLAQVVRGPAAMGADGLVVGTPAYLAPEGWRGTAVGPRTDLYAVGVLAYYLVSGSLPFVGIELMALCHAHLERPAPPLQDVAPSVPAAYAALVADCLAKSPSDRPTSAEALDSTLAAIGADLPAWEPSAARAWWAKQRPGAPVESTSSSGLQSTLLLPDR